MYLDYQPPKVGMPEELAAILAESETRSRKPGRQQDERPQASQAKGLSHPPRLSEPTSKQGEITLQFSEDGKTPPPQGLTRPARALIGWMPSMQGEMMLQGNTFGQEVPPEVRETARLARETVAARKAGVDQGNLITDPPSELDAYIARLKESTAGGDMFKEGWRVAVADLDRVCAFQPYVFADNAAERVEDIKADDIEAIAAVSLPVEAPEPPRVQFDPARQAYMVLSPNPNLRIIGQFQTAVQEVAGAAGLGFLVRVMPSFMQVVEFQGRYFLRDGYHRAFGLLGRGITQVPVFTRTMDAIEEVTPQGTLPQAAYLGERPPLLPDYHASPVAQALNMPAFQRMIVIQGIELSPGG